ncbi:hypothetical protein CHT98_17445 (plasmid) [Azospirillum brasilense]|uniref:Uncharacterized protein n=2 Tax=Azospirillaceae TaxID=2829815 RepID=A0A235HBJ5_AZOBR|nr:hypothetical protein CHT98_17445 [Azospirillum brasilense]
MEGRRQRRPFLLSKFLGDVMSSNSVYRWIKVEGRWEPAQQLADGSYMPIGDIVPLSARSVKVGPVIEPPPRNAAPKDDE